jgi:hypothetical protein
MASNTHCDLKCFRIIVTSCEKDTVLSHFIMLHVLFCKTSSFTEVDVLLLQLSLHLLLAVEWYDAVMSKLQNKEDNLQLLACLLKFVFSQLVIPEKYELVLQKKNVIFFIYGMLQCEIIIFMFNG